MILLFMMQQTADWLYKYLEHANALVVKFKLEEKASFYFIRKDL